MAKSIKFKNNNFLDSTGIVHRKENLDTLLRHLLRHYDMDKRDTNLDNYVTPGLYQLGLTYQNGPKGTSGIYGVLIVITSRYYSWNPSDMSNWLWQIILDTSMNIYFRAATNSTTFSEWLKITSTKSQVLWKNTEPTKTFTEKQITLSSSDYSYFEIFFKSYMTTDLLTSVKVSKGFGAVVTLAGSNGKTSRRNVTRTSDTSFTISNVMGEDTNNELLIPYEIIGYK